MKEQNNARTVVIRFVRQNIMYLVMVALCLIFTTQNPTFLTGKNLMNIVNQAAYQIIVGVGVGMLMISGAIDLSVGYQMSVSGVIMGWLLVHTELNWVFVLLIGMSLCMAMSLFNGLIAVKFKVFPFIITLASSYIFEGISYTVTQAKTFGNYPAAFKWIGQGDIGPIPVAIILMVICLIIGSLILNKTYFGRYIYGIGSNQEAVELAGVKVNKVRLVIYALSGLFIGLGTVALISRTGSSSSAMGPGTEFVIIAGGILGGIKMQGGGGRMSSIVVGVLIMTVLANGMQLMQLNVYPQYIAKGLVLIFAICFDAVQSRQAIRRAKFVKDWEKKT